nr:MAG TPA: hypothetical protein [Caudoviricetes sp.]
MEVKRRFERKFCEFLCFSLPNGKNEDSWSASIEFSVPHISLDMRSRF